MAVALDAGGPWEDVGPTPWAPRAGAAVIGTPDGTRAILASGLSFVAGAPAEPVFGDVWALDVAVCLLAADGSACGGHGVADLVAVTCACDAGYSGRACEQHDPAAAAARPQRP